MEADNLALAPLPLDDYEIQPPAPPPAAQTKSVAPDLFTAAPKESSAFNEELLDLPPAAADPTAETLARPVTFDAPLSPTPYQPPTHTPAAAAAPAPAPAPLDEIALTPANEAPAAPIATGGAPAQAPMDRDFIARNQIVERYLSGRLPLKGATEFEKFCRDNPAVLDELGLADRVNAGLRLLDASGKPEPWQDTNKKSFWQKPHLLIGLTLAVLGLGGGLWYSMNDSAAKDVRIAKLQAQAQERPLEPATSTREIRLLPSREGGSNTPAIMIGGGSSAQLVDLKIDESRSPYKIFRVTIDRLDQGRVAIISELAKDSNGHLRIALNSSALGPGSYQLTIEGLTWRGDAEPDSWITIGVQR